MPPRAERIRLDSPADRLALPYRDRSYWLRLGRGRALGYARLLGDGSWSARIRPENGGYLQGRLGSADDYRQADGQVYLSIDQAIAAAREWFTLNAGRAIDPRAPHEKPIWLSYSPVGPVYTVAHALADYLQFHQQYRKQSYQLLYSINAWILPDLGPIGVDELTPVELRNWMKRMATSGVRLRSGRSYGVAYGPRPRTEEEIRKRRASANRMLRLLKAVLNMALREGKARSDLAWRVVPPYKRVHERPIRFLDLEQCRRLIDAAQPDLRLLILAALYTGARISEIRSLVVADVDFALRKLLIRNGKMGKHRYVALPDEGMLFFADAVAGRGSGDLIFREQDGGAWGLNSYLRLLRLACRDAGIEPAINFHTLRHTYASLLAMNGVPLIAIARHASPLAGAGNGGARGQAGAAGSHVNFRRGIDAMHSL